MKKFILLSICLISMFAIASIDVDVGNEIQTEIVQNSSLDAVINVATIDTRFVHLEAISNPAFDQGMNNQPGIQNAKYNAQTNLSLFYTKECGNSNRIKGSSGGQPYTTT